jgi:hypothetical protein
MSILEDIGKAVNFYVNRWQVTEDGKKFIEENGDEVVPQQSSSSNSEKNKANHQIVDDENDDNYENENEEEESENRDGFHSAKIPNLPSIPIKNPIDLLPPSAVLPLFNPLFIVVMALLTISVGAAIFALNMNTIKPAILLGALCFTSGGLHLIIALFAYLRKASWFPDFLNILKYNWLRNIFTVAFFIGYLPILVVIFMATLKIIIHLVRVDQFVDTYDKMPENENTIINIAKLWSYLIMSFPSLAGLVTGLIFLQRAL